MHLRTILSSRMHACACVDVFIDRFVCRTSYWCSRGGDLFHNSLGMIYVLYSFLRQYHLYIIAICNGFVFMLAS